MKKLITGALMALMMYAFPAQGAENMNIVAVGAASGGTFTIGLAAVGKIVTRECPGAEFQLLPGAASGNIVRASQNKCDLTVTQHVLGVAAVNGTAPYRKKIGNVCSILNTGDLARLHIVAREESKIESLEQLFKEKRGVSIGVGPRGGMAEVAFNGIVESCGLTYADLRNMGWKIMTNATSDSVALMQDGLLDIFLWFGPNEGPFLQELVNSTNLKWISLAQETAEFMKTKYGFSAHMLPDDLFPGKHGDVLCIGNSTEWIVSAQLPEEKVYNIIKLIMTHRADIALALPEWDTIDPKVGCTNLAFPLHPGAERYYREIGSLQ